MKFAFSLQPLLDLRVRIEDEMRQAVGLRRRELDEAMRELDRLADEFHEHARELRAGQWTFAAEHLRVRHAHLQSVERAMDVQRRVVAERQAALDRARHDAIVASKERKLVDALKERQRLAFAAEEMRAEQIELDDGNGRLHGRIRRRTEGKV